VIERISSTDNAWMETIAYNFHDETGNVIGSVNLEAGDDASHVKWIDIDKSLKLYASHAQFISKVAHKLEHIGSYILYNFLL